MSKDNDWFFDQYRDNSGEPFKERVDRLRDGEAPEQPQWALWVAGVLGVLVVVLALLAVLL